MSTNYDGLTRNTWPGTWSSSGTHPIVLDREVRGGLRFISGSDGDQLTDIQGQRLQEGMLVYVKTSYGDITGDKYYTYKLLDGESRDSSTGDMPNNSGNWSQVTFGGGSDGSSTVAIRKARLSGSNFVFHTNFSSHSVSSISAGSFSNFASFNQVFLNGLIQDGKEKSTSTLNELISNGIDYVYDNDNYIYFLTEDIDNGDFLICYGNEVSDEEDNVVRETVSRAEEIDITDGTTRYSTSYDFADSSLNVFVNGLNVTNDIESFGQNYFDFNDDYASSLTSEDVMFVTYIELQS